MTVIRPNSVSGITSITAQANEINFFRSNGALAGLQLNGVNFNTTTGVSTFNNLDVGGVLTYQDVTNVDSIGIITARSTIDAQGDVSIADKIIHTGDTNTAIRFPAADTVSVETSGSEALRIDSSQRLLLGTSSVGNASAYYDNLVISNTTSAEGSGITLFAATNGYNAIDFGDTAAVGRGRITYYHADDSLRFDVAGSERFRIDGNGKFCFGTYNSNFASNDGIVSIVNAASSGTENPLLTLWNPTTVADARAGIDFLTNAQYGTSRDGAFIRGSNDGSTAKAHLQFGTILDETYTETLRLASDGIVTSTATHPQIILKDPSNRQISLRAPSTTYQASVGTDSNHALSFYTNGYSNERMRITNDGKVGINKIPDAAGGLVQLRYTEVFTSGTTNLLTSSSKAVLRLQTSSNSSKSLYFGGIDESATPYLQVGNMSSASGGATATYPLVFQPYGGNVAIGNASPQQLLHVWPDNANTTSAYIRVTSGDRNSNTGIDLGSDADGNGRLNVVSNGDLKLYTNNTERLNILNTGAFYIKSPSYIAGDQPGEIQWWNENGAGVMAKIVAYREGSNYAPSGLKFYTTQNVDTSANNSQGDITERLFINSEGKFYKGGHQFYPCVQIYEARLSGSVSNSSVGSYQDIKTVATYTPKKVGNRVHVQVICQSWNGSQTDGQSDAYARLQHNNNGSYSTFTECDRVQGNFQFDERYHHNPFIMDGWFTTTSTNSTTIKFQGMQYGSLPVAFNWFHSYGGRVTIMEYDIT